MKKELIGEGDSVKYSHYDGWVMHTPPTHTSNEATSNGIASNDSLVPPPGWNGTFKFTVGEGEFEKILQQYVCPMYIGGRHITYPWYA